MKISKRIICSIVLVCIFLFSSAIEICAAEDTPAPISPALSVMAEDYGMAIAGLVGGSIAFEADDFARALNLSSVGSIVITEAPPVSDGELRVGTTVVNSGQTVSSASLSLMSYTPSSSNARTTFRFRTAESGYDIPCTIYMLSQLNHCPTLDAVPENTLNVSTHRNVTLYGSLPCHDPDGDQTTIEIVSYPKSGLLNLTDRQTGEYTYTPEAGYSGKDSFTYVARDIYGNYSAAKTVSLEVNKPKTTVTFADMSSSPYYNAALTMLEEGIMGGTQVGSEVYFYPKDTVSRGEFVVMTLHAIGMDKVTSVSSTPFADDADIPSYMKGYVAAAYDLGYIKGTKTEDGLCFQPNRSITRAEAAVILSSVLDIATPTVLPTFSDSADLPAWAAPAVYSLNGAGIMSADNGNISPLSEVTRADAAQLLTNLIAYVD